MCIKNNVTIYPVYSIIVMYQTGEEKNPQFIYDLWPHLSTYINPVYIIPQTSKCGILFYPLQIQT